MGLISHLSYGYNTFSSYCISSSLLLILTSLTMMVMGPGSPPVCAFIHSLNYQLIVLVDCHIMKSPNPFVVSVEYFPFLAQKLL